MTFVGLEHSIPSYYSGHLRLPITLVTMLNLVKLFVHPSHLHQILLVPQSALLLSSSPIEESII